MRGYRNLTLGLAYLVLCAWLGWVAGAGHVGDLGSVLTGIGVGVTGIIGARAANKWASKGDE